MWGSGSALVGKGQHRLPPGAMIRLRLKRRAVQQTKGKAKHSRQRTQPVQKSWGRRRQEHLSNFSMPEVESQVKCPHPSEAGEPAGPRRQRSRPSGCGPSW